MEQHFVVMRLRRRATLLALSKYEFTFNVYNILTNDDLFLSHFVAVGLALAGLFVALVILLVVVWAKKMKRVQKRASNFSSSSTQPWRSYPPFFYRFFSPYGSRSSLRPCKILRQTSFFQLCSYSVEQCAWCHPF